MRYFVNGILTDVQRRNLTEDGVEFEEMVIGSATFHRHGVAFPYESSDSVTSALGLVPAPSASGYYNTEVINPETHGVVEGLQEMRVLDPPTAERPAICLSGDNFYIEALQSILNPAYAELQLGMVVDRGTRHRPSSAENRPGLLYIRLTSVPQGTQPERLHNTSYLHLRVVGSTRNYTVVRNADGRYIALFQGNAGGGTLWLLFSPEENDETRDLLAYTLHSLARQLHPELGDPLGYAEYQAVAAQRRFMALALQRLEEEARRLPTRTNEAAAGVSEAQAQLTASLRQVRAARRRTDQLAAEDPAKLAAEMVVAMEQDLKLLQNSPDFETVEFHGGNLVARTRSIELAHNGIAYSLGEYEITATHDRIRVTNPTLSGSRGPIHPHVSPSGDACFGNQATNFAKLLADMRYGVLLPMLVAYLERGYQPGDSYYRIESFNVPTRRLEEANV